jgi:multicomponent Na+:H+ antiporter subunit D
MSMQTLLLLTLALPLLGAALILLTASRPKLRDSITLVISVLLFLVVFLIYQEPDTVHPARLDLFEPLPGLRFALEVEALGMLFALIASFLWIITSVYAIGYMRSNQESNQTRFFSCFAVAIAATMGVAFSANLFSLFLFYEVLTLSTYPLVAHSQSDLARRAGRVYLGILLGASFALFLPAIVWTWVLAGQVDFTPGGVFDVPVSNSVILALLLLYLFGIGKAAVMPFHAWLPAAMVAPTPVSALLHAVAVVKAGVFSIVKVAVYIFGEETLSAAGVTDWIVYLAGFTIITASLIALYQDNLKKRLAYSTISQLSYVVIATFLIAPVSILAAALHIAAHAFGKITLFFAAGAIYTAHHKTEVSQLDGIGRQMPLTMIAFAIASLSMIGVPPTAGFISKWYLLNGAFEMQSYFVIAIIVTSTLLNAAYFLPIVYAAFFKSSADTEFHEAPWTLVLPILMTAFACLLVFFFPDRLIHLTQLIAF